MDRLLVLGDSVPLGDRTAADPWPDRVGEALGAAVAFHGSVGTSLADLADEAAAAVDEHADASGDLAVLVQAGHNDAQLSGGDPRVPLDRFRAAASRLDDALADHPAVETHAFVGLVPLLDLDDPDSVPFADVQPERSLSYDEALAETVATHVPVARPVDDWHARTADGVHPNEAGHAAVAERVLARVDQ